MVYHICNRILFRGFNTYTGKTKILKSNGNTARGQWIAGQLVEIQTKAMAPEKPVEPILCLAAPGKRIDMISARAVIPSTISQFTRMRRKASAFRHGDIRRPALHTTMEPFHFAYHSNMKCRKKVNTDGVQLQI